MTAAAMLFNWLDVLPGDVAAFRDWHSQEHIPERVGIPGFLRGRRYRADGPAEPGHGWLALYDAVAPGVFASADYGQRLDNPTAWTRRALPLVRQVSRTACRVVASVGASGGPCLATCRLSPPGGGSPQSFAELAPGLGAVCARGGALGVTLLAPDAAITHFKDRTREGVATDAPPATDYPWMLVAEADSRATLDATIAAIELAAMAIGGDCPPRLQVHRYRLDAVQHATPSD